MRLALLRVVFLGVFFLYSPLGNPSAYAAPQSVYHVPPNDIASYIAGQKGRKRAVVVWASWCPYCRKDMSQYIAAEKNHPGSMVMLSIDEDLEQLRAYLDHRNLAPLKVIIVKHTAGQSLDNALSPLGIRPVRSFPTVILLDEKNAVVRQGDGSSINIEQFLGSEGS